MNHIITKHMTCLDQAPNNTPVNKSMTIDSNAIYSSKNPIYVVINRSNDTLNSSLPSGADAITLSNANTKASSIKLRKFSLATANNSIQESKDESAVEVTQTLNMTGLLLNDEAQSNIFDQFSTDSASGIATDSSCKISDVSNKKDLMNVDSLSKSIDAIPDPSTNDDLCSDFSTPNTDVLQHMDTTLEKCDEVMAGRTNSDPVSSSTVCCTVIVNTNPVYSKMDDLHLKKDNGNCETLAVPIQEVSSGESAEQKVSSGEYSKQNSLSVDDCKKIESENVLSKKRTAAVVSDENEKTTLCKKLKKTSEPLRHQQSDVSETALNGKQSESMAQAVAEEKERSSLPLPVCNTDDLYARKPPPVSCIAENNNQLPVFKESILDDCAAVSATNPPSSTKVSVCMCSITLYIFVMLLFLFLEKWPKVGQNITNRKLHVKT